MSKHSETPWICDDMTVRDNRNGFVIAECSQPDMYQVEAQENAALIVRCVNSHDELVAACRTYVAAAMAGDNTLDCFKQVYAALLAAEGK